MSFNFQNCQLSPSPFSLPSILLFLRTFQNILSSDMIDSWALLLHAGCIEQRIICCLDQVVRWPELHPVIVDWVKAKWHAASWSVCWFVIVDKCNLFINEAMKTTRRTKYVMTFENIMSAIKISANFFVLSLLGSSHTPTSVKGYNASVNCHLTKWMDCYCIVSCFIPNYIFYKAHSELVDWI